MSSGVNYALLHPAKLVREEIHSVLIVALGPARLSAGSLREIRDFGVLASVDLLVASFEDGHEDVSRSVLELRSDHPALRLLILASTYDPAHMKAAILAGADGYLFTDASRELVAAAVGCLLRGGHVLPVQFRELIGPSKPGPQTAPGLAAASHPNRPERLSERETEVARHLAQGASNKMIAREWGLSEATVKVHVRSIFRKLGFQNRKQVASWAQQNLSSRGGPGYQEKREPVLHQDLARKLIPHQMDDASASAIHRS